MNPLNSILLEGNVVKQPSIRETAKGTAVCTFSIASNRSYRSDAGTFDREVSFFDVEVWDQLAIICSQKCTKGRGVRVVGRLKQGRWTDTAGKNHSKVTIIAEHVEMKPVFQKEENPDFERTNSPQQDASPAFEENESDETGVTEEKEAAVVF